MRSFEFLNESQRAYLFHGTDINSAFRIVQDGKIDGNQHYAHHPVGVSLTRQYLTALDFGRFWERQFPVVFVFDQQRIIDSRLKLAPRRDSSEPGNYRDREAEEHVLGDLPLEPYLVSINIPADELQRALAKAGEEYRDYLQGEGWDELTKRKWKNSIQKLVTHPKLNAIVPSIDPSWRARQNRDHGYWQLSESWNDYPYEYVTCCVNGGHGPGGEAIHDMVERGREISYRTFMKEVGGAEQMARVFPMYNWPSVGHRGHGLAMKDDYTMQNAFYRSTWYGLACVYCVWSGIEYIFTKGGVTPESQGIDRQEYLLNLDIDY